MKVERKITPQGENFYKAIKDLDKNKKVGKVGWFKGAKYADGTQVAYVATIQEYGVPEKNIPPRPTMRPTVSAKQNEWKNISEQLIKGILDNGGSIEKVLDAIGQRAAGDIRETIRTLQSPPLKQSTIDARLSKKADKTTLGLLSKPLIDSKILLNSLTSVVEDK